MKGLEPQPRPRGGYSWSALQFLLFVLAVWFGCLACAFGIGWWMYRHGAPVWIGAPVGAAYGLAMVWFISWVARRR